MIVFTRKKPLVPLDKKENIVSYLFTRNDTIIVCYLLTRKRRRSPGPRPALSPMIGTAPYSAKVLTRKSTKGRVQKIKMEV